MLPIETDVTLRPCEVGVMSLSLQSIKGVATPIGMQISHLCKDSSTVLHKEKADFNARYITTAQVSSSHVDRREHGP